MRGATDPLLRPTRTMAYGPSPLRPRSWRIAMRDRAFGTSVPHVPEFRTPAPRGASDPLALRLFPGTLLSVPELRAAPRPGVADPSLHGR